MRKLAGLMTVILWALLLAACGSDDDNGTATEKATTVADIATEAATEAATVTATSEATEEAASMEASSPVAATGASPAAIGLPATPASAASPVAIAASPIAATPTSNNAGIAPVVPSGDAAEATPAATEAALTGRVELPGTPNEAWVLTSEGCVGLGANTSLKPGQQLVVRDAEGAIVGVTMLAASDETDACSWDFSVTVPDSPFYEVSVPMAVEHVFTRADVEQSGGELVIPAA